MSCGIYKITNNINNRCYIGQSVNIERRFYEHKSYKFNTLIHKALQRYGKDNFKFEIIIKCLPKDLTMYEKYFIKKCKAFYKDGGYNLTLGGESNFGKFNPFYGKKHNKKTRLIMSKNHWMKNKKQSKEYIEKRIKPLCKQIEQYDLNWQYIKTFNSIKDASQEINRNSTNISRYLKHGGEHCGGYKWKYVNC